MCSECKQRPPIAKGLCQRCYDQKRSGQRQRVNLTEPCINGDGRPQHSKGLCQACYRRERRREMDPAVGTRKPGPAKQPVTVTHKKLDPVVKEQNRQERIAARVLASDTHCANGHEFTLENIYVYPEGTANAGKKVCKRCRRDAQRVYQGKEPIDAPIGVWNRNKTHCPHGHEYTPENTYYSDNVRHCRKCTRESRLATKYGLRRGQYDEMFFSQQGGCAACGIQLEEGKNLCVDHDHTTGDVRGLLCNDCNIILGHAHDEPERLARLVVYLISTSKSLPDSLFDRCAEIIMYEDGVSLTSAAVPVGE